MKCVNLLYAEIGQTICDRTIFITGSGRSGTTILGQLIHSMHGVEYAFEPPSLIALLPMVASLSEKDFRVLFEAHCVEDLLIGQVTGRAINLNKNDDSYIGLVKTRQEINRRIGQAWSKATSIGVALSSRLAVKIPDMTMCLEPLRRLYPHMTFVVTERAPDPVIQSVLRKGWFTDTALAETTIIWPSQTRGFCTPFWVAPDDIDKWRRWAPHDRAAYYYIRLAQGVSGVEGVISVPYEKLVEKPAEIVAGLAARLGLEFGDLTPKLIESTFARSEPSENWIARLSPDLGAQLEALMQARGA